MKKLTIEDFKERANKIHHNKYVYDKTDLNNRDEDGKVIVTCPIHGDFKVEPNKHLVGIGCSKCANNIKRTKEEVINDIKRVHGNKYIIPDDFEYISNKKPMHIICPIHGDFHPSYRSFVTHGHGCKKCSCHIYENDEFINDIRNIYGDIFDYDKVMFKGYRNEVIVKCNKCGKTHKVFPKRLLDGNFKCDCSKSPYTILESVVANKLNELNIEYEFQFKRDWLKNKEPLSIDFYLPKYNVGIECQGRFHFEPYKKNDKVSIENYNKQAQRDKFKYQLCKDKNLELKYYSNIVNNDYFAQVHNDVNDIIKEIINK